MSEPDRGRARLDSFVDAAFAFAVTLLVVGGGDVPANYAGLARQLANLPAFAVGFAIVAMLWAAHASRRWHSRWRFCSRWARGVRTDPRARRPGAGRRPSV